ncbi:MAG: stalk domain-containing protein [Candidatus Pristimantibacillus sp.]
MKSNKWKTKLLILTIAAGVLMSPVFSILPADYAEAASTKYTITQQPFNIKGSKQNIGAIINNGSTYIALRDLNTALGLTTKFNSTTQMIQVSGKNRVMEINLKNNAMQLNGQILTGPQPIVQNYTTYLPLRFLLEHMGYAVTYQNGTKLIGVEAIKENDLKINAEVIGADGDGKSLLVYYPVISGYSNNAVQKTINTFLKQKVDKQISAATKQMNEASTDTSQLSFDGRYTVSYNEKGKLSIYMDYYIYLGGAHGDPIRVPYTFDLATGAELSLQDVVQGRTDYVSIINQNIKAQIKNRQLSLQVPFETIEKNRKYFLNRNGIVIYFEPYEYTSFADGMPQFVIPYSAFK